MQSQIPITQISKNTNTITEIAAAINSLTHYLKNQSGLTRAGKCGSSNHKIAVGWDKQNRGLNRTCSLPGRPKRLRVIGLPVPKLYQALKEAGIKPEKM